MTNRITAPMKALMIAPTTPPAITTPIRGKSQPAIKPPTMPTMAQRSGSRHERHRRCVIGTDLECVKRREAGRFQARPTKKSGSFAMFAAIRRASSLIAGPGVLHQSAHPGGLINPCRGWVATSPNYSDR
jgi:hypothetical protein